MATSFQSPGSQRAKFQRFAKIVFEESHDRATGDNLGKRGMWTWGGVDLCCPPPPNFPLELSGVEGDDEGTKEDTTHQISTVRIELQQNEYSNVLESLKHGTNLFASDIAQATILVKMGPQSTAEGGSRLHLTAVALDR